MKTLAATFAAAGLLFGALSTNQSGIRSAASLLFSGISVAENFKRPGGTVAGTGLSSSLREHP